MTTTEHGWRTSSAPRSVARVTVLVARCVQLVWRAAPREFVWTTVLQAAAGLAIAGQLLMAGRIIDVAVAAETLDASLWWPVAGIAVATVVVAFAQTARVEQQRMLTELVARHAVDQVLDVATRAELLDFDTPTFHDRLQRASVNAQIRPVNVASGVVGVVSAGCTIIGVGAALLTSVPLLVVVGLLGVVPTWLVGVRASRAIHHFAVAQTTTDRRRSYLYLVLTDRDHAQEVRSYDSGAVLRAWHDELFGRKISALRALVRTRLRLGLAGAVLTAGVAVATLGLLLAMVASGRLDLAEAGTAAAAVVVLGQRLQMLARSSASLYEAALFVGDFTAFVDDARPAPDSAAVLVQPRTVDHLGVRDVTFTYPGRESPSVRDVTLDVKRGEVVALVGENGSGKTTLAKLLGGLYRPDSGSLTWNGSPVDDDAQRMALRRHIAVLFQDFARYRLQAATNVGLGHHERLADDDAIVAAARLAKIDGAITDLENGYRTWLGGDLQRGAQLSMGQWQRLALARALFRDASLVVLDEPSAALDPRAESELFDDVRQLCRDRAVVMISHRLASVCSADRIYVLSGGRVVEQGTHRELMGADGLYAELFALQATRYLPVPASLTTSPS
jgi:ATP-binding cassette subfamily B protein